MDHNATDTESTDILSDGALSPAADTTVTDDAGDSGPPDLGQHLADLLAQLEAADPADAPDIAAELADALQSQLRE